MYTPDWPLNGHEHREYTQDEISKTVVYLRSNFRMTPEDRLFLATMLEQLQNRILQLRTENDKLVALCKSQSNG